MRWPPRTSTDAARGLRSIFVFRARQTAGRSGHNEHRILSRLSCRWKLATPCSAPFSERIFSPSSCVFAIVAGSRHLWIASARRADVSSLDGIGHGPAWFAATSAPQNGWSPKNGIIAVGRPIASPIAVVPAPPWCITQETCWNSQSCGQLSRKKMSLCSMISAPNPPQPLDISARWPVDRTAASIVCVSASGWSTTMDPNPMYIGVGPDSRNSRRSTGGS